MWKLLQFLIVSGVVASNVAWEWTPNPLAATVVGVVVAFVVTDLGTALFDLLVRWCAVARGLLSRKHLENDPSAGVTPSRKLLDAVDPLLTGQKKVR